MAYSLLKMGDRHLAASDLPENLRQAAEPVPVFQQAANEEVSHLCKERARLDRQVIARCSQPLFP